MSKAARIRELTPDDWLALERSAPQGPYKEPEDLVYAAQAAMGLPQDGDPGRMTLSCAHHPVDELPTLARELLRVALSEVGNGEVGGNNSGPHVAKYHGIADDGDRDDDGSWCSAFVGWVVETAYHRLDALCPVRRISWARSLAARCRRAGVKIEDPADVLPGDVVLWERGSAGGSSHIGIARTPGPRLVTIEGNVGRFPAKVRPIWRELKLPQGQPESGDFLYAARLPSPSALA